MDLNLAGKVALVTGSSRGIGRSIAKTLWSEGCFVALNGRSQESLGELARTFDGRVSAHAADVTEVDACCDLIASVTERWGRLGRLAVASPARFGSAAS